jgi:hypothetical protein
MGVVRLLTSANGRAFLICSMVGYLIARLMPPGAWVLYLSMLVSYHLYLGWLVISAEHEAGFSLPILSTVFTHLCCLGVVLSLPSLRHVIPYFAFLRFGVTYLASYECQWLLRSSGARKVSENPEPSVAPDSLKKVDPAPAPVMQLIRVGGDDDHDEWLRHLANRTPATMRRGQSIKEEHDEFMRARANGRVASQSAQ